MDRIENIIQVLFWISATAFALKCFFVIRRMDRAGRAFWKHVSAEMELTASELRKFADEAEDISQAGVRVVTEAERAAESDNPVMQLMLRYIGKSLAGWARGRAVESSSDDIDSVLERAKRDQAIGNG